MLVKKMEKKTGVSRKGRDFIEKRAVEGLCPKTIGLSGRVINQYFSAIYYPRNYLAGR